MRHLFVRKGEGGKAGKNEKGREIMEKYKRERVRERRMDKMSNGDRQTNQRILTI
jgi:hypothetical protein